MKIYASLLLFIFSMSFNLLGAQTIFVVDYVEDRARSQFRSLESRAKNEGQNLYIFELKKKRMSQTFSRYKDISQKIIELITNGYEGQGEKTDLIFCGKNSQGLVVSIAKKMAKLYSVDDLSQILNIYSVSIPDALGGTSLTAASAGESIQQPTAGLYESGVLAELESLKAQVHKLELNGAKDTCVITKTKVTIGGGFVTAVVGAVIAIITAAAL